MPVWSKSEMEAFYASDSQSSDCEVRIDGSEIVVTYEDDGIVTYRGSEVGPGHFVLKCPERNGSATLHRIPGSDVLDGFWTEAGYRGMWRLSLDNGQE